LSADDPHALIGAYLLHSLSDPERVAFEEHLRGCEGCRREVERLRDATIALAPAPAAPPGDLRHRIVQQARATPQEPPSPASPGITAASPWPLRLTAAVAAVLLIAAGGLSYALVTVNERLERSRADADRLVELLSTSDLTVATARGVGGTTGRVVSSASRDEALLLIDGLEPASPDETYQLWFIERGQAVSAGLLEADAEGRTLQTLASDLASVDAVGVTLEPAGGSAQPTTDPVLLIDLAT
jgi:anti-sigma-K factor RskA